MKDATIGIATDLFSPTLGLNKDAIAVIKQSGKVIHASTREYVTTDDVVDNPAVGTRTH
jgi:hypothetical protein